VTASAWDSTTNIAHYARLAKELRELAAQAKSAEAREQMIVLAAQYEHLAEHAATSKSGSIAAPVPNARSGTEF
jgi:hypothetical protein